MGLRAYIKGQDDSRNSHTHRFHRSVPHSRLVLHTAALIPIHQRIQPFIMVKALTKVVYKPDSMSTEEYSMIVDATQVSRVPPSLSDCVLRP